MKKGLIIKKEWLDKIFDEGKVWEMRSTDTKIRGRIGLIQSGSGLIVGEAELIHTSPVTEYMRKPMQHKHQVEDLSVLEKWRFAWVLQNAKRYETPKHYKHPQGAVIWVNL